MLYIVPTPIGNMEDITIRAISILKEVDLILAEDTRISRRLLDRYQIDTPLSSFHTFNEHRTVDKYLDKMAQGMTMGLVSDAGTPAISDPGYLLVNACISAGVEVQCLPGPTALIPAVVLSGLPSDKFFFEGFLPHKKGRKTRWEYLKNLPSTFILYESPHRIVKCLGEVILHCGEDRKVAVVRELSKSFEEVIRGTCTEVKGILEEKKGRIKGEFVVVIEGVGKKTGKPRQ